MLCVNVIDYAWSEWASKIVFASKRDGLLRVCLDDRYLRAVAVKEGYSILRMKKSLGFQGKVCILLMLDINSK